LIIDVYGFTDTTGPEHYNLALGQRRADAVVRYIATKISGPTSRIASVSFGESQVSGGGKSLLDAAAQQRRVAVTAFERVPPQEQQKSLPQPRDESS
jgi:outer membrane protein OmpA-like peptidoglycan-associated protein